MPSSPTLAAKDFDILLGHIRKAFPDLTWSTFEFIDAG